MIQITIENHIFRLTREELTALNAILMHAEHGKSQYQESTQSYSFKALPGNVQLVLKEIVEFQPLTVN